MRRNGYEIVRTNAELEEIPQWRRPKLLGLFSEGEMAYANEIAAGSEQPALADMTRRAIELLQWNTSGYLLIVDAGLMRTAARENRGERTLAETVELDRAVAVARSYMGRELDDPGRGKSRDRRPLAQRFSFSARQRGGVARGQFIGRAGAHLGDRAERNRHRGRCRPRRTEEDPRRRGRPRRPTQEPAAAYAPEARNTVNDVLAAGRGPGTETLHGFLDNTVIFKIIAEQL